MNQAEIRSQTDMQLSVHIRRGLCRAVPGIYLRILAIGLLAHIFAADVSAGPNLVKWQPFEIRPELEVRSDKNKTVKQEKVLTCRSVRRRGADDGSVQSLRQSPRDRIGPNGGDISGSSDRVWHERLLGPGFMMMLPENDPLEDALRLSDILRNALSEEDPLIRNHDKSLKKIRGNGRVRYFRVSFLTVIHPI